jgi:hypothetical protein
MVTDEEYLTNNFNKFIKKWCGGMYAHLVDTDENDGEGFRGDIILTINKVRQKERTKLLDLFLPLLDELIESKKATARCHSDGEIRGIAQQKVYDLQDLRKVLER